MFKVTSQNTVYIVLWGFTLLQVPVNKHNEMLQSMIKVSTSCTNLIKQASLIIWDEAPMVNHAILSCINNICMEIGNNNKPFGGKDIILLSDFCQTCPVVWGGLEHKSLMPP
ncbi:hypothetical protein PISMIDRAFT_92613 [Pisolithus microcarpus 441]|uniref:ATP-dependent DNA helicase n=1 Tax=Pisolithus microcarpus 441 TaxID=765257 RepID=A0A0C9ZP13_9AGAM|nr:PIF1-like helicase-domain-containing protein [Pisolithus microcarpus]KIK27794.1 hypothetical protein PISMIDRAFT_92613 [Pisolithus microcarpus 441]